MQFYMEVLYVTSAANSTFLGLIESARLAKESGFTDPRIAELGGYEAVIAEQRELLAKCQMIINEVQRRLKEGIT